MSTTEPDPGVLDRRDPGVNPFEAVLWVVAVVFVAAGVFSVQWAARQQSLANGGYYCDADGNCTERYDVVLAQTIFMLAPAVVAAGLFALVVAIALRALAVNARRLAASGSVAAAAAAAAPQGAPFGFDAESTTMPRAEDSTGARQVVTPDLDDPARFDLPRRAARARLDHSAFMRPRGD